MCNKAHGLSNVGWNGAAARERERKRGDSRRLASGSLRGNVTLKAHFWTFLSPAARVCVVVCVCCLNISVTSPELGVIQLPCVISGGFTSWLPKKIPGVLDVEPVEDWMERGLGGGFSSSTSTSSSSHIETGLPLAVHLSRRQQKKKAWPSGKSKPDSAPMICCLTFCEWQRGRERGPSFCFRLQPDKKAQFFGSTCRCFFLVRRAGDLFSCFCYVVARKSSFCSPQSAWSCRSIRVHPGPGWQGSC